MHYKRIKNQLQRKIKRIKRECREKNVYTKRENQKDIKSTLHYNRTWVFERR